MSRGHVSGAHYNPANTLGFVLRGRMKPSEAIGYWAAQFAGAIVGALLSWACMRKVIIVEPSDPFFPAMLVEALFTFALCMVVFNVADTDATKGNSYYGVAIGFTITAAAIAGGKVSGGAFNPAVGPASGAILASIVYRLQHASTASADS